MVWGNGSGFIGFLGEFATKQGIVDFLTHSQIWPAEQPYRATVPYTYHVPSHIEMFIWSCNHQIRFIQQKKISVAMQTEGISLLLWNMEVNLLLLWSMEVIPLLLPNIMTQTIFIVFYSKRYQDLHVRQGLIILVTALMKCDGESCLALTWTSCKLFQTRVLVRG